MTRNWLMKVRNALFAGGLDFRRPSTTIRFVGDRNKFAMRARRPFTPTILTD